MIQIENNRIELRTFKMSDYQYLLPFSEREPEIWKYSLQSAAGADALSDYLMDGIEAYREGTAIPLIIYDKHTGQYVGATRLYKISYKEKTAMLGYSWLGRAFQGTGLNRNAKLLLLEYAFETMGLERVEFRADARNARSVAALKSIGCTMEGILRGDCLAADGTRRQTIVFSILKSEWNTGVKNRLLLDCLDFRQESLAFG
jgi:N-acetyltransferase